MDRTSQHKQRIVKHNSNSTYSQIILPSFKEIWDFKHKYNQINTTDALKKISQVLKTNCQQIMDCYKLRGNKPSTAITVYTLQSFVYEQMNSALREDNDKLLELFAPYIYQLITGLNREKNYFGAVYRAIQLPSHFVKIYTKNTIFFWPGFTSSSQDKKIAANWPGSNCLFEITIPKRFSYSCANIDHLSAFQKEKEVLIQPYSCYRVLSNRYDAYIKKHVIKLIIEATCYNLSGIWCCHDTKHNVDNAGIYFVAQYGQKVYWFGKKNKAYWDFANVGYGTIATKNNSDEYKNNASYDELCVKWTDLPIAHDKYAGKLQLQISSDYQSMTTIANPGGVFWGNKWTKKSNIYLDTFSLDINHLKWKADNTYSGVWRGNYGGHYIISVTKIDNVRHISWIAYSNDMSWAHVAFGVILQDKIIKVDWGDLLIGMDRYHGKLECVIKSKNEIVMQKSEPNNIFLTQYIVKQK